MREKVFQIRWEKAELLLEDLNAVGMGQSFQERLDYKIDPKKNSFSSFGDLQDQFLVCTVS